MAIAIDSTTPAYVQAPSGTSATASFSPPANSFIVVPFANQFGNAPTSVTVGTGTAITFTKKVSVSLQGGECEIWTGQASATPGSITVQVVASGTLWDFGAIVVTGAAATQTGAATGTGSNAASAPSITTGALAGSNSLVVATFTNTGTAGATLTMASGNSNTFGSRTYQDPTNANQDWAQYLTGMNIAAGGTATLSVTAPSTKWCGCALEILAASTAAASPTFVPNRMPLGA